MTCPHSSPASAASPAEVRVSGGGNVDARDVDDLFSAEAIRDPYAFFGPLRDADPVHWNEPYQLWVVTSHRHVVQLVRAHEMFSSAVIRNDSRAPHPPVDPDDMPLFAEVRAFRSEQIVEKDRPRHAELRGLLRDFFTPTAIESWRPFVRDAVRALLDEATPRGGMDVLADLGARLPVTVIATMMGVPPADHETLRELADKLLFINRGEPYRLRPLMDGIRGMQAYVEPLVEERARAPGRDFISLLATAEAAGVYTRAEVLANAALLLFAGHETTTNLICNGVLALLQHAPQWERFTRDPAGHARGVTEECLRYDPPVKSTQRIAARDVALGEKTIRAGDRMRWVMASANRDPAAFADPDVFDIARHPNPHVSFGGGVHHCLGASLARVEGQEVFRALAERLPGLRLAEPELRYQPSIQFRSLVSLRVEWS